MKKTILLAIMIIAIFTGIAAGEPVKRERKSRENKNLLEKNFNRKHNNKFKNRREHWRNREFFSVIEIKEVSGIFETKENSFPVIKTEKEEIKIMLSKNVIDTLTIKSGNNISVKGFVIPVKDKDNEAQQDILKIFELEHAGKKYFVRHNAGKYISPKN
jgi:hypothetical protein